MVWSQWLRWPPCLVAALIACMPALAETSRPDASAPALFARDNLVAWCVVPYDGRKRGPEARAEMLRRSGISRLAYDWRDEHLPTFDEEVRTLERWGIELRAVWFPPALNHQADALLEVIERHGIQTELWVSLHGGEVDTTPEEHARRVEEHVAILRPIVERAAELGCTVGLYNHMGWFGEPENQIDIIEALGADNVGIVYNLHHGHAHLERFPEMLATMKPHLLSFNLNGMSPGADALGDKIMPLGNGSEDLRLLREVLESGYDGPIGILGHTMDDAEDTLRDNLDGLDWLLAQLDGSPPPGPRPPLRVDQSPMGDASGVSSVAPEFGLALSGAMLVEGDDAYRVPPITVELRARLHSAVNYNILIANDTKASGQHWEIFTMPGSGHLTVYAPGLEPDHLHSEVGIVDGEWHHLAMHYDTDRMALFVNGAEVAAQSVRSTGMAPVPGGLGIGRLVESGPHCDGELDDIRISSGIREITVLDVPLEWDDATVALWDFDDLQGGEVSQHPRETEVEDAAIRAALPEFQVIPAANPESLAAAKEIPEAYFQTWHRSHGDPHNTRYARLDQITRENVHRLRKAWEYRSGDGEGSVQGNPVIVEGTIYTATAGEHLVAIDAATGEEKWRFKPGGIPAHRGMVYWPGEGEHAHRLLFTSGASLWALDPDTGEPIAAFGDGGRVRSGESRVAGAVYEGVLVLPLFLRDVAGYDVITGERLWYFNTIPEGDEYGADTWETISEGANAWGGMALDEARGIAYIATGSPKPNFAGNTHRGQNLFSNCILALDALTGERVWHFQEIRHDIWDMDIPAPPNLVTIDFEGRRVDAVAQVTKLGNTLLLDRESGESLFPVRFRRAPVSTLPGERTWPYQPDIELPEPFARQAFSRDDVTERTELARTYVHERIEKANYGWFAPFEEDKPTVLYGIHGGAEWTGAAFDPESGRLFVSSNNIPWIVTVFRPDAITRNPTLPPTHGEVIYREYCMECHGPHRFGVGMNPPLHGLARRLDEDAVRLLIREGINQMPAAPDTLTAEDEDALLDYLFLRDVPESAQRVENGPVRYTHNGYPYLVDDEGYPGVKPPWGTLNCIDLASGRIVWQRPLGYYPELAIWGDDDTGAENFGGPSVTAGGLVFCAGTPDDLIRAFDADTGEQLWEHALPFGGYAPPSIYRVNGKDHVLITATGGGKLGTQPGDALVAFALE